MKYHENEKSFKDEIKRIFHHFFKGLSVAKNCLRPEIASLKSTMEITEPRVKYTQS